MAAYFATPLSSVELPSGRGSFTAVASDGTPDTANRFPAAGAYYEYFVYLTGDLPEVVEAVAGRARVWVDGGFEQWEREGRPVTAETPAVTAGTLSPLTLTPPVVDADYVRAHLKDARTVIIDARDPEFYRGERTGGSATAPHKTGHIEGARSVPYSSVVTADNRWKSDAELRALFTEAGVKPGDTVVAYCHIGQQATTVIFAARRSDFTSPR